MPLLFEDLESVFQNNNYTNMYILTTVVSLDVTQEFDWVCHPGPLYKIK